MPLPKDIPYYVADCVSDCLEAAAASERERCAKIAEGFANYGGGIANSIATAIRNKD